MYPAQPHTSRFSAVGWRRLTDAIGFATGARCFGLRSQKAHALNPLFWYFDFSLPNRIKRILMSAVQSGV
jgi:hypothetical protein